MLYRCRKCEHELAAGRTPTVTCGLYPLGLLALSSLLWGGVSLVAREFVPPPPPDPPNDPWWLWPVCVGVGALLWIGTAWTVHFVLAAVEWVGVRWSECPSCGARDWSKGYTSGFGL